jgi:hypothetical protein
LYRSIIENLALLSAARKPINKKEIPTIKSKGPTNKSIDEAKSEAKAN